MWRSSYCALLSILLFSTFVWGNTYRIALPLIYSQNQLGDLSVNIDTMSIKSVSVSSLKSLLDTRLTPEFWPPLETIAATNSGDISVQNLEELGVNLALNTETLFIEVKLSHDILADQNVQLQQAYPAFIPSASGTLSWLNSFNLSYSNYRQDNNETWSGSIDWLSQMNIGGATGANILLANYLEADDDDSEFIRGEWVAFYDQPNSPLRASIGDIVTGESGHLYSMGLGGITLESRYEDLQPDREIGPQSSQQLVLLESAEVEVYINGERVSGGRLEPGRYNLQNLILDNGANDITVVVNYVSGKQETLQFTQFYNAQLLEKGLANYAVSVGKPVLYKESGIEYEDIFLATGFIEYGLTDWLTLGSNGLAAEGGFIFGGLATINSSLGNTTARLSSSQSKNDDSGWTFSLDYEHSIIGAGSSQSPNLRLAYEQSEAFNSKPWLIADSTGTNIYTRYLANYYWQITSSLDLTLTGRVTAYDDIEDELQTSAIFSWREKNVAIGVGTEYEDSTRYPDPDTRLLFTFEYNWYSPESSNQIGLSYNSENERSRAYFSNEGLNYVGDVGVRVEAEHDEHQDSQRALFSYTANRFRAESEFTRNTVQTQDSDQYVGAVRVATAIGMVDGTWGWGRAQSGPFVVAEVHPTLKEATANLDVDSEGRAMALATVDHNALFPLSQPYAKDVSDYTVTGSPAGYDWGDGKSEFSPGAATGHILKIGSEASYTVKGYLRNSNNEAIGYRQGKLVQAGKSIDFFTNKNGLFYIQGVMPGDAEIGIYGAPYAPTVIKIPSSESSLITLETLYITCRGTCDENL